MIEKRRIVPDKVKIGPFTYKVLYPDEKLDGNDSVGLFEHGSGRIRLSDRDNGEERNDQKIVETFMHEIFHGIDCTFCGDVMPESTISLLSTIWHGILVDNDLMLNSLSVPKSIKVGGTFYKVIYPFVFDDGDNCIAARTQHSEARMVISDDFRGTKSSKEFVQANLILCIMSAVVGVFETDISELPETALTTFCAGLYGVLRDNDLQKWVKGVI